MSTQRPKYRRAPTPPAMRFQARDGQLLQTIYDFDGVVAKRQLKTLFWPDKSVRAMEKRLSLLYHNGYLDWPGIGQWRSQPIPEPVCWLGWKGIIWLAGRRGIAIEPPQTLSESRLRRLERVLREEGVRWVREPRWSQLPHDLSINDVRIRLTGAVEALSGLTLERWVTEGAFAANMDVVAYTVEGRDGRARPRKRGVRPDGYFVLRDEQRVMQSQPARARFLLEVDNATHDLPSFGREKVLPGIAYLKDPAYRQRFGATSGRWLVVTLGTERRMLNLLHKAQAVVGDAAALFYFTTRSQLDAHNPLTAPIWHQAGSEQPFALVSGAGSRLGRSP